MKHTTAPLSVLTRGVLLEALRGGLPWVALACVLAALGLSLFLSHVALNEGAALRAAAAAALLRACAMFVLAAHVAASVARESSDKGLELVLALPVSRPAYYLGKLAGFAAVGVLLAAAFALPLLGFARPAEVGAWALSLAFEAALVAAAALLFASVITHSVAAIAATAGLYLLSRAITSIQAIASGPLADESAAGGAVRHAVDGLALVLPRLDAATRSDWLVYGAPPPGELGAALAGMALFTALLAAAGLFDFSRRNL